MKTLLVTGSSRGIGRAVAELAHAQGYRVIVHGRTDSPELNAVHQKLKGSHKVFFDIADKAAVDAAMAELSEEVPVIDVLVNNAGAGKAGYTDVLDIPDDRYMQDYTTNVLGTLHCIQAVLPGMLKQGKGAVVSIASIKGHPELTTLSSLPYGLAKAGVVALSKALAKAYPMVRFNTVSPGYTETDMAKGWKPDTFDRIKSGTLAGRIGQPEEIAATVLFLASDGAGYITGTDCLVDGGYALQGK